mgnify:CR=1 FL=1|jgi:8-oxo-dGTP pyrophosphatase MutT (NUDIX family)
MTDILFDTENFKFSYRVAGILVRDHKVLVQKATDEEGYAFPGGHVSFGETNEQTLIREFKEELNVDIIVKNLKWVAEIFFPIRRKLCHQICLYYIVNLSDEKQFLPETVFIGGEYLEGRSFDIEFHWIPVSELNKHEVYPPQAGKLILQLDQGVEHFVYKE